MAAPETRWHNSPTQALLPSDYFEQYTLNGDVTDLPYMSREIRVATAGNLVVLRGYDGVQITLAVLAGEKLPIQVRRIIQTGTTATGIIIYY